MPLVRVPAQYPRNAASRGIEGYVVLQFDINKEGTVENVQVVEADPANIFDRAAIRAVEKFKYKPRIVNGQPAYRYGVQFQFTFNLDDAGR
jgi:protein TonB